MVPNLDILLSFPPVRGAFTAATGVTVCNADHVLNIAFIDFFVRAVSLVLIDAGTLSSTDGAMLLVPFAWSYWMVAKQVSSFWILSVCANKTVYWSCCSSWATLTLSSTVVACSRRWSVEGSVLFR